MIVIIIILDGSLVEWFFPSERDQSKSTLAIVEEGTLCERWQHVVG